MENYQYNTVSVSSNRNGCSGFLKNNLTPYPDYLLKTKIARNSTIRHLQQLRESEHQLDCQPYVDLHQNRCLFRWNARQI